MSKQAKYSHELGEKIAFYIANTTLSLADISKKRNMPNKYTMIRWACSVKPAYAKFKAMYEDAYKVRVNLWIEERDEISQQTIEPLTPVEIGKKYNIDHTDVRIVQKYVTEDTKARQTQQKQRLDTLSRNIDKIAVMFDKRFAQVNHIKADVKSTAVTVNLVSYVEQGTLPQGQTIEGEKDE